MNKYTLIFIFLSVTLQVTAQSNQWNSYTSGWNIKKMAKEGNFIWVCTEGGLVRLNKINGDIITYTKTNSGLPDNNVTAVIVDAGGVKWIGTAEGGLAKFNGVTWTVYNTSNSGIASNSVTCITHENNIKWIGTKQSGLSKFNNTSWTNYSKANSAIPSDYIFSILVDGSGNKWMGSIFDGLIKFSGSSFQLYDTTNSAIPFNAIVDIALDNSNNIWMATMGSPMFDNGGLVKFDGTNFTHFNISNSGIPSNKLWGVVIDNSGRKWIATEDSGVVVFNDTNWTIYNTRNSGIKTDRIKTLLTENSGSVWVGTFNDGLLKYDGTNWITYATSNNLLPNSIHKIIIDPNGTRWFLSNQSYSTSQPDLVSFDGYTWRAYGPADFGVRKELHPDLGNLFPNKMSGFTIDKSGVKWLYFLSGDLIKWTSSGFAKVDSGLIESYNMEAFEADNKGRLWMGRNKSICKFDGFTTVCFDQNNTPSFPNIMQVNDIAVDKSNRIWAATHGEGLLMYNDTNWVIYNRFNSPLPTGFINAVTIDENGNKWLTLTEGGIVKFDGVNWTIYNTQNSGLPSNDNFEIVNEGGGVVWVVGPKGVAKFDGTSWVTFNESNSLLSNNYLRTAAVDLTGNKWFGSYTGVSVYNEKGVKVNVLEKDIDGMNEVSIFPNPMQDRLHLKCPPDTRISLLEIFSIQGVRLLSQQIDEYLGAEVNVNQLPKGMYIVTLSTNNGWVSKRVIKN